MASDSSIVLIVGAAGGIGQALGQRLAARGCQLIVAGRNEGALAPLAEGWGAQPLVLDARDPEAVVAAVAQVVERWGRIDGAVNLAGSIVLKPSHSTSPAEWHDIVATNLTTAFALVRAVAPVMAKADGGSIVLMSSAAARVGLANHDAIAAAKAGVTGLALAAAATYAPRGVRINVVAPGLIRTPLASRIVNNPAALKVSEAMHPLGRIGEPAEVASAIDWLLNPDQSWVTGQVLGVDGGLGSLRGR